MTLLAADFIFSLLILPLGFLNLLILWFSLLASHFMSFSSHSRGTHHVTGTVSNEATSEMGYPAWPAGRTCFVVITCCSGLASIQLSMSADGKRLNLRTSKSFLQISALLSQSVKVGTILLI